MFDLPEHLLVPCDENGDGPVDEAAAVRWLCWCGDNDCRGENGRSEP